MAQNIRKMRGIYHVTQEKLAERAEISLSYLADIEYRKTWVSDKTLRKLASVFNMQPYELLIPYAENSDAAEPAGAEEGGAAFAASASAHAKSAALAAELTTLVAAKKTELRALIDDTMSSFALDLLKAAGGASNQYYPRLF